MLKIKSYQKQNLQKLVINNQFKSLLTKTPIIQSISRERSIDFKQKDKNIQLKSHFVKQTLNKDQTKANLLEIKELINVSDKVEPKDNKLSKGKSQSSIRKKIIRSISKTSYNSNKYLIKLQNQNSIDPQAYSSNQTHSQNAKNEDKLISYNLQGSFSTQSDQSQKKNANKLKQQNKQVIVRENFKQTEIEQKFCQQYFTDIQFFKKQFCQEVFTKSKARLGLNSNILSVSVCFTTWEQIQQMTDKMLRLKEQNASLQLTISERHYKLEQYTYNLEQKQKQTTEEMKKFCDLQRQIKDAEMKYESTVQEILLKQQLLKKVEIKTNNIFNFVQQQEEKKILHWVSEAYKKIEEDIYDYATYLQCNSMASSLTWQPKPFRAVEKWVDEQMQRVNHFISSKAEQVEDKTTKMKQFVLNTMRKFKTKDQQMTKITDFKTECIKKFIKMMQKWLQNWQLKQEYLVGLRKQFCVQSQQINVMLAELVQKQRQKAASSDQKLIKLQRVMSLWNKVQINYKYGNSFY